jgi:hypothetical protein
MKEALTDEDTGQEPPLQSAVADGWDFSIPQLAE